MKKIIISLFLCVILIALFENLSAQVAINEDGSDPDSSAILDLKSSNKGFLPPRLNSDQMTAISSPPEGLVIYNTTIHSLCWYDGTSWKHDRDGKSCGTINYESKIYETVIIGTQCWMQKNLNVGSMILNTQEQTNQSSIEKYCYQNSESNCDIYGGLYQWNNVMQWSTVEGVQGICPTGWHVPTNSEWNTLQNYLGGYLIAGGKMKETGTTHWQSPNVGATNSSGFTGLGAGGRDTYTSFGNLLIHGYFTSSSHSNDTQSIVMSLTYSGEHSNLGNGYKQSGYSLRCIKNN